MREEDFPAARRPAQTAVHKTARHTATAPEITGPRFRGKVVGNWTNRPKGQAGSGRRRHENERKDVLLYRQHVASGLQLKAGDRVAYGHRAEDDRAAVARNVTKVDAVRCGALPCGMLAPSRGRRRPAGPAPLSRATTACSGRWQLLERTLARRSRNGWRREDEELAKALMLSAAAASEDDRRRREQEAAGLPKKNGRDGRGQAGGEGGGGRRGRS